ncbi:MAG: outer membrane protein assembly factor BamD [Bacteriovoracia bacterium]
MKFVLKSFSLFILGISLFSCSGKDVDENDPNALYKEAEEAINDKRFVQAIDHLKLLKNKFPYNHLSTMAALKLGDVYYLQESYSEAAGTYENFRDLHPKFEKADYVLFRIGESYFNQLPGTEDRDLTPAQKAIDSYRELAQLYPKSTYIGEAQTHLKECLEKLSAKEKYIGDFYYKRGMYDSAAKRYEKITEKFSGTAPEEYAYWHWGRSLYLESEKTEEEKQQRVLLDETKHIINVYLARFPDGTYSKKAKSWLEDHERGKN